MHPVLFEIGPISVGSYYLIWGVALCVAVFWMRSRCERRYGISYNDASDVLQWTIFGVFVGAMIGGYLDNWERYARDPISMLYFWNSGMSSGPGFIGGGIAGLYKLKKLGLKANAFADAASIPSAFMIAFGRWGCFLGGCCRGVGTDAFCAVTFPDDPSLSVYPSQLFESAAAFAIGVVLVVIERRTRRSGVLWPLFMISYGAYRVAFDFLRAGDRILGLRVGQYCGAVAVVVGVAWLISSLKNKDAAVE